ncbi:nucleotidyltransferase family protein [Breoghania sp.]|uniref:nucleotidyltransferase family protein n=1 Tax=Breoghania sp. TaxID=2065378 RepID=UPI002602796D|nr:nucleotidyltransferase family protein [Breoghania sp.]MDJ0931024.1 nucleotidyltransferase family protein [Breoghania sp.]
MTDKKTFRPHKAMILAAGLGKRMRPLTATTPKPLVEVAGKALIDRSLDRMVEAGVETAVVNVHWLADLVEVHLARRSAPKIEISDERDALLETGGGIVHALDTLGPDPFLLFNSDSFWIEGARPNLNVMFEAWDDSCMDALLMLASTVETVGYPGLGDFVMDRDGLLSRREERKVAPFAYAGTALLHPRLFDGAPEEPFSLNELFDKAIEQGRLYGVRMEGLWIHVGTPDAIAKAEAKVRESAA